MRTAASAPPTWCWRRRGHEPSSAAPAGRGRASAARRAPPASASRAGQACRRRQGPAGAGSHLQASGIEKSANGSVSRITEWGERHARSPICCTQICLCSAVKIGYLHTRTQQQPLAKHTAEAQQQRAAVRTAAGAPPRRRRPRRQRSCLPSRTLFAAKSATLRIRKAAETKGAHASTAWRRRRQLAR